MKPDFSELWSVDLVEALVDAGGTLPDVARAFERGYGHISGKMLKLAGFPEMERDLCYRLFNALRQLADFAFTFEERTFHTLAFGDGRCLFERAGVRRRGLWGRFRHGFTSSWHVEFDTDVLLMSDAGRILVIANCASEKARRLYPAGAYISVGRLSAGGIWGVDRGAILDPNSFIPVSRMLDGLAEGEYAEQVQSLEGVVAGLEHFRFSYESWLLTSTGGLPHLIELYKERAKRGKRRPYMVARYSELAKDRDNVLAWRKPTAATLELLDALCQEDLKKVSGKGGFRNLRNLTKSEDVFRALLGNVHWLFMNFNLTTRAKGDLVPIGWGLSTDSLDIGPFTGNGPSRRT